MVLFFDVIYCDWYKHVYVPKCKYGPQLIPAVAAPIEKTSLLKEPLWFNHTNQIKLIFFRDGNMVKLQQSIYQYQPDGVPVQKKWNSVVKIAKKFSEFWRFSKTGVFSKKPSSGRLTWLQIVHTAVCVSMLVCGCLCVMCIELAKWISFSGNGK